MCLFLGSSRRTECIPEPCRTGGGGHSSRLLHPRTSGYQSTSHSHSHHHPTHPHHQRGWILHPLDECNTGNDATPSANLPPKVNGRDSQPQASPPGKAKWDTMSSNSSSAPSDSAPSPPPSRPESQIDKDIYDIPPVRQAVGAPPVPERPSHTLPNDEDSPYKLVPGAKDPMSTKFERQISKQGNRGSFSNSDDMTTGVYDIVPPPGDRSSVLAEEADGPQANYDVVPPPRPPPLTATTEDLYQVPPKRALDSTSEGMYDVPPSPPPIPDETYDIVPRPTERTPLQSVPSRLKASDSISKSTDDLARSFEEISQHNAHQSVTNGDLEHSTYDPIPALDLNASIGSNSSFSVFADHGASSTGMDVPPRPAKPSSLGPCPSTPPPSVEDSYMPQPSHNMPHQDLMRKLSNIDTGGSPHRNGQPPSIGSHHMWLEQPIQPPSYANTKRNIVSSTSVRPNSYNPQGYWPMHNRGNTVGGRVQSGMGFHNGQSGMVNGHPQGYMAMQGKLVTVRNGLVFMFFCLSAYQ